MLVSLPFAWKYLLPDQLIDFSKSQIASLLFSSNFYWLNTLQEYGAESSLLKPFLHTWSLAVEEQFYIFFPLLFVGIYYWRKSRYTTALLTTCFVFSLLLAEWLTPRNPSSSFYMLPGRFWELLAGGILANILQLQPQKHNNTLFNRAMPIVGLSLIGYSISVTSSKLNNLHHPGFATLIPVTGTILILWFFNERNPISKVLANKLLVNIGLISYSLYLWHYPIFAFGRIIDSTPSVHNKLWWILVTFFISTTTFLLIEQPFRDRKMVPLRTLVISVLLLITATGATSFYWIKNDGFDSRLGYLNTVIKSSRVVWVTLNGEKCHSGGSGRIPEFSISDSCVFEYHPGQKYLISIGDSHAAMLSENLRILAKENGLNFIEITNAGCPHILDYGTPLCKERAAQVLSYLENFPNAIIVYSARIPLYIEQSRFDNKEGDQESNYIPIGKEKVIADYPERSKMLLKTLNDWKNAGHTLVIVYPVSEQGFRVDNKLFTIHPIIQNENQLPDLSTSYTVYKESTKRSFDVLDFVIGDNVFRVYPDNLFCDEKVDRCYASKGSKIFFAADNHVSPLGSSLIVTEIAKILGMEVPNWNR
jgi:peptidoglycan/LPS O-acetylase OafA/YrhL